MLVHVHLFTLSGGTIDSHTCFAAGKRPIMHQTYTRYPRIYLNQYMLSLQKPQIHSVMQATYTLMYIHFIRIYSYMPGHYESTCPKIRLTFIHSFGRSHSFTQLNESKTTSSPPTFLPLATLPPSASSVIPERVHCSRNTHGSPQPRMDGVKCVHSACKFRFIYISIANHIHGKRAQTYRQASSFCALYNAGFHSLSLSLSLPRLAGLNLCRNGKRNNKQPVTPALRHKSALLVEQSQHRHRRAAQPHNINVYHRHHLSSTSHRRPPKTVLTTIATTATNCNVSKIGKQPSHTRSH